MRCAVDGRCEHAAKLPEVEIPKIAGKVEGSQSTRMNPPASITVTLPATPTTRLASAARSTDKRTDNSMQRPLAQSAQHSNAPEIKSPGIAGQPAQFTPEDRNTTIAKPKVATSTVLRALVSRRRSSRRATDDKR